MKGASSEADDAWCQWALGRVRTLWRAPPGSPEAEEIDMLAKAIDLYESTELDRDLATRRASVERGA